MEKKKELEVGKSLKNINICLYIIIGLLSIMTITLIASGSNSSSKSNTDETETNENYDVSMFEATDQTRFMELANGKDLSVFYLGRETCTYCVQFLPTLQKAQEEIGYTTYYVDVSAVDSSSGDYTKMTELIDSMTESYNEENDTDYESLYGYTPMIAIVQNGKIKDLWIGAGDYSDFTSWLAENGVK